MGRMGLLDRLNQLDDRLGVLRRGSVTDPHARRARLERLLRRPLANGYTPAVVFEELLSLRDRVDALEAQVQSLTSTDGS